MTRDGLSIRAAVLITPSYFLRLLHIAFFCVINSYSLYTVPARNFLYLLYDISRTSSKYKQTFLSCATDEELLTQVTNGLAAFSATPASLSHIDWLIEASQCATHKIAPTVQGKCTEKKKTKWIPLIMHFGRQISNKTIRKTHFWLKYYTKISRRK